MNTIYSRIQIPKSVQQGDISELYVVKHQDLAEFGKSFKIDAGFKPVNHKTPRLTDIIRLQEHYVKQAMDMQANLALIDRKKVCYMRCQEQKSAGTKYVGVGVGAIVCNPQGKILLIKRGPLCSTRIGQWENPGGTQEIGETLSEAAERETKEETGYLVKAFGIVSFSEEFDEGQHWNSFGILCNWYGKRSKKFTPEKGKVDGIEWYDPEDLPENISKGSEIVIKDYLTGVQIPINRVSR